MCEKGAELARTRLLRGAPGSGKSARAGREEELAVGRFGDAGDLGFAAILAGGGQAAVVEEEAAGVVDDGGVSGECAFPRLVESDGAAGVERGGEAEFGALEFGDEVAVNEEFAAPAEGNRLRGGRLEGGEGGKAGEGPAGHSTILACWAGGSWWKGAARPECGRQSHRCIG